MRKNVLNFVVDSVTLLTLLWLVLTGLLIEFILPPRRGTGVQRFLWGMDRHDWGDVHFWTAAALGGLLVLHVALHWKWVCATAARLFRPDREGQQPSSAAARTAYGAALLAVLAAVVGGFLWLASASTVGEPRGPGQGRGRHAIAAANQPDQELAEPAGAGRGRRAGRTATDAFHIRGATTLAEIEKAAGIPLAKLLAELRLPPDTDPQTRLGQLRQRYGFELEDVRSAVDRLLARQGEP